MRCVAVSNGMSWKCWFICNTVVKAVKFRLQWNRLDREENICHFVRPVPGNGNAGVMGTTLSLSGPKRVGFTWWGIRAQSPKRHVLIELWRRYFKIYSSIVKPLLPVPCAVFESSVFLVSYSAESGHVHCMSTIVSLLGNRLVHKGVRLLCAVTVVFSLC